MSKRIECLILKVKVLNGKLDLIYVSIVNWHEYKHHDSDHVYSEPDRGYGTIYGLEMTLAV